MDYIENMTSPNTKYCYGDKQSDQDILTIDFYINEYNDNDTILNNILDISYIKIQRKILLFINNIINLFKMLDIFSRVESRNY